MSRIGQLGKLSPFQELERIRRRRLLVIISTAVSWTAVPATITYGILFALQPSWQLAVATTLSFLITPAAIASRLLAQRDKMAWGSFVVTGWLLFAAGLIALMIEGLPLVIAPAYIVIIVLASPLVGEKGSYAISALAYMLWASTLVIVQQGLLPPVTLSVSTLVVLVINFLIFFFVAFLSQLSIRDLRRALDDATYDLVEANRQLEEGSNLKTRFVARMSHDLRTPLNAVLLSTQLVLREAYGPVNEEQKDSLARVSDSAMRLEALINDILDISKLEAGELNLEEDALPVSALAHVLRAELESFAREKDLEFIISTAADMPERVLGDETRLSQILINLTHNAIKFTDQGEVRVTIEPTDHAKWHLVVQDTGHGIYEENFDRIFDEFSQESRAATASTRGTGLGLAITKHLVELMEGEIRLESKIGAGSVFEVILPLKLPDAVHIPLPNRQ